MTVVVDKKDNKKEKCSVYELANGFKCNYLEQWWKTCTELSCFSMASDKNMKRIKEKETDKFVKAMVHHFKAFSQEEQEKKQWCNDIMGNARAYAKDTLEFKKEYLDIIFSKGFIDSTSSFIKEAKAFAPSMKIEDIFQAIRNVWIMNSIQVFLDKKIEFSPSVFSYSMLYPYTDNYLDSNEITLDEKVNISIRFRKCLAGEVVEPCTKYEKELFDLVYKIENEYARSNYPKVYQSLLGIHDAQQNSLMQQTRRTGPYERDIIGISFLKGGMSVLADAYLVNGDLDMQTAEFMFGFGVLLQLADDLQDVSADMKNGHMTIFSQVAGKWPLDSITNRLLNFISSVMHTGDSIDSPASQSLKELIRYNCNFLILQAIAKNTKLYSKEYVKGIESYSMFGFPYLKKLYSRLQREYIAFERSKNTLSVDEMIYSALGI